MQICQRPIVAVGIVTLVLGACSAVSSQAQQPEPLRLSSPPAHALVTAEPPGQEVQTQTAMGELLDVDGRTTTFTIKTQSGEMTFRYNDQTKVTGAQKGVTGLATMTGAQVVVMYRKDARANLATAVDVKGR
jgi:hypothetical protein